MNEMNELFCDMVDKGLASMSGSWIQRAVQQKHNRLTLDLAYSILLNYSSLDRLLLQRQKLN
ncbi:hypothetical protein ACFLYF_02880 [Chloroflexota bacterium]